MDFNDYKNVQPFPEKPKKPDILRKSVDDLTDAQLANVRGIKKAYQEALDKYEKARDVYYENEKIINQRFRDDLKKEFAINDALLHNRIFAYAWEKGHSEGYEAVYAVYDEIVDVIFG